MKNRKTWFAALALVLVMGLMGWLWLGSQEKTIEGGKEITVTVVHGDGSEKVFAYGTNEDYLGQIIVSEGLAEGVVGPYGLEVHTVDGETASWAENHSYWAIFIGEEYAVTGADEIVLTDGGQYSLVYTIG